MWRYPLWLSHRKFFLYEPRGFSSIEEHDEAIIKNWNDTVAPDDIVYLLGDVMLGDNEHGIECLKRLNGYIHIIYGNHDNCTRRELYKIAHNVVSCGFGENFVYKKTEYWLSHYPMLVANFENEKPVWNIHAHTHQKKIHGDNPHCLCVSMDAIQNTPLPLEYLHTWRHKMTM